jgi:ElaB/YqjD/DUF883 family membrane-anchored ribosome-binding protein
MKEAYKKKAEAELELGQAKLAEYKARAKNLGADTQIKYEKQVDNLEHGVEAAKRKLTELGEAGEDAWEHLKENIEKSLRAVKDALGDIAAKFKD